MTNSTLLIMSISTPVIVTYSTKTIVTNSIFPLVNFIFLETWVLRWLEMAQKCSFFQTETTGAAHTHKNRSEEEKVEKLDPGPP